MSTFTALPQQLFSLPLGSHVSNIIICTGPSPPKSPPIFAPFLPAGSPVNSTLRSIPTSPDRSSSSSPFAPTAADMPTMTQPASMSQCGRTGWEACTSQSLTPTVTPEQPLKRPKCVEAFQTLLKKQHSCKCTATGSKYTGDSFYMDVSLVQSHSESKTGKNATKGMEKDLPMYDLEEKENSFVERSNLFQVTGGKQRETKTIALLGHAGMGKSVLVNKVCQDWSTGGYSEFPFVFRFECRRLNLPGMQYSLKDLLFELSARPQEKCDEVFKYILRNPGEVLLIFDGFDEFQAFDGLMQCSVCSSSKQSHTVKELFAGLFLKKLLRGCTVLITARPKDKFNQYLSKADKVVQMMGFSPQHVNEYMEKHFEGLPFGTDCIKKLKECQYLFSYCYIPLICRTVCVFCETEFKTGDKKIPLTLTSLLLKVLKQDLSAVTPDPSTNLPADRQCFSTLASLALTLGEKHQNALKHNTFPSTHVKDFALKYGFMQPFPLHSETFSNEFGSVFSSFTLQNFLVALHLLLSDNVRDKSLIKYISFEPKKKKLQDNWTDVIRRFLTGLLFLKADLDLSFASEKETPKSVHKKQNTVSEYLKSLKTNELGPNKLLELCHCSYESQDSGLLDLAASKIEGDLSFLNVHLTPPDVYVLQHIFRRSANTFSLDLRNSGIELQDLKQLVGLDNVVLFRASLSDTVRLWESLQQTGELELLRLSIKKLTIQPFKAKSMKDIADLSVLVDMQEKLVKCDIHEIPAIKTLKKLEFALGPVFGLEGFLGLVKIIPAFSSLQHLDLDSLSENNIGDKGAEKLTEIFPALSLLETLHLSQNRITDFGVKKLAKALPSLACLQKLSLYNNQICDAGAENIADTLPLLTSLTTLALQYNRITDIGAQKLTESLRKCPTVKCLKMWNPTIPHGVLERLQQQDSRIS